MSSATEHPFLVLLSCLCFAILAVTGCSTGPAPLEEGTPAFYWSEANRLWEAGDLTRATQELESLVTSGEEYADQAQSWLLITSGGMTTAYMELADAFEEGSEANESVSATLRKSMNDYRSLAKSQAETFFETFTKFQKAPPAGNVQISFTLPQGSTEMPLGVERIKKGEELAETQLTTIVDAALRRGVLLAAAEAAGVGDEPEKVQTMLSGPESTIPVNTFMLAMATKLNQVGEYFWIDKLSRLDNVTLLNNTALKVLEQLPETDESKELKEKIDKDLEAVEIIEKM